MQMCINWFNESDEGCVTRYKRVMMRLDNMKRRITMKLNHITSMEKYMLPKICENIDKLMTFSVELQQSQVRWLVYFTIASKKGLKCMTHMMPGLINLKNAFHV